MGLAESSELLQKGMRFQRIGTVARVLKELLGKDESDPVNVSLEEVIEMLREQGLEQGLSKETVSADIRIIKDYIKDYIIGNVCSI